ncbi:MAG: DUF790 family protein [Chloroflexi bacterium]|nr:DUF790 family protein [Chloroflexota bacterium]
MNADSPFPTMPFPLTDLRRTYGRSGRAGGPPDVRPYLLVGSELAAQRARLNAAVEWYERHCGSVRNGVDFDALAQLAGDYRLARCLAACLQSSYRFEPQRFDETLAALGNGASRAARLRLSELGITTSSALRLHVFEAISRDAGGFVAPERRAAALAALATELGLRPDDLDHLLWLDADAHHRLRRVAPAPTPEALAAGYNRRALETLLSRTLSADLVLRRPDGTAIKRFYFLAKRHGLLCDLELAGHQRSGAAAGGNVIAHLFGPLEAIGPRTRHGDRFAGAILALLCTIPDLAGRARVLVNEREYLLRIDARVAESIRSARAAGVDDADGNVAADDAPAAATVQPAAAAGEVQFDSEVEARLYTTLRGMEARGDAHGWRVEREPEPLIHGAAVVVPDFAMAKASVGRPETRIFVEVVGFWTPAYRQRKRQKLAALAGCVQLALVVQEQLMPDFQDLPFPVLPYRQRVSAFELIRLLDSTFDGPEARLETAKTQLAGILDSLDDCPSLLPEDGLRHALGLTTADDLQGLFAAVTGETGTREPAAGDRTVYKWLPGIGLCGPGWLEEVQRVCLAAVERSETAAPVLDVVRSAIVASELPHATHAAERLDVLLPHLGFEITWHSLFDATVRLQERGSGLTAETQRRREGAEKTKRGAEFAD